MIRQFTTPVLIRLKLAKSSDIVSKVVIGLCFSGIGLSVCKQDYAYSKSYERILMKFSGAMGVPQEEVIRFRDQLPQLSQESLQCKNWGLGLGGGLHSLSTSNVSYLIHFVSFRQFSGNGVNDQMACNRS